MPSSCAAPAWVSPSMRRRRRNADLMQACASWRFGFAVSGTAGLNSLAPIAVAERTAFDRYADGRGPLDVTMSWVLDFVEIESGSNKCSLGVKCPLNTLG